MPQNIRHSRGASYIKEKICFLIRKSKNPLLSAVPIKIEAQLFYLMNL